MFGLKILKPGERVVLSTLADGVLRGFENVQDRVNETLFEPVIRLGVTGLARSGKTVFITSLVANLLNSGRMPHLLASKEGRIEAAFLQPQPDDTVPRFDYEAHIAALSAPTPSWPESTRAISELRLSLRVRPNGLLAGFQGPRTVHIDIVDYPGEWLLDLALLDQSYEEWSAQTLARLEARDSATAFRARLSGLDVNAALDEPVAQALARDFAAYLNAARAQGYYDCTPGRFLLPGDLAGSPVLTFAPLPSNGAPPRRALIREMQRRFEAYKARVVKPFFRDHFSRIDRQIVLVDALSAIHNGPEALEEMRAAMAEILSSFRPGRNAFLSRLLRGKRVEKILFAATKADHLHHAQHPQLSAIMQALTASARDRARFAGAKTSALPLAALRATTEIQMTHDGALLNMVKGRLLETGQAKAFYPGALPSDPTHLLTQAREGASAWLEQDFDVMRFAPPRLELAQGQGPNHIWMDRAAEFLIGDAL